MRGLSTGDEPVGYGRLESFDLANQRLEIRRFAEVQTNLQRHSECFGLLRRTAQVFGERVAGQGQINAEVIEIQSLEAIDLFFGQAIDFSRHLQTKTRKRHFGFV